MTPGEILENARLDGVSVSADGAESVKVVGDQSMVEKWLPAIRENKTEILAALFSHKDDSIPAPCTGCRRFEVVGIQGEDVPGCLYQITDGEWMEGWKRLPRDMEKCIIH